MFVLCKTDEERQSLYNAIKDVCYSDICMPIKETLLNYSNVTPRFYRFNINPLTYLGSWHSAEPVAGYHCYSVPDFLKLINNQLEEIPL